MHQYKWHSSIKWGPYYDPKTEAHYASATDLETLMSVRGGPTDPSTVFVKNGRTYEPASEVPIHLGGYSRWFPKHKEG